MKLIAELLACELIDKDEEEKDTTIKLSCEGLESSELILEIGDRKFKVDASEVMECVSRVAMEWPSPKPKEDD